MKTSLSFIALVLVAMMTSFFSNAEVNSVSSESRIVNQNFYGIVLNGNANVYVEQGNANSIRIEGNKENLHDLETSVDNGVLIINSGSLRNVDVFVTLVDINLLQVNGSGVIKVKTTINSDMLLMKVVGDGIISSDVRTLSLGMIVNGSGKILVGGITGDSFVKVKGDGKVVAMNLESLRDTSNENSTPAFYHANEQSKVLTN